MTRTRNILSALTFLSIGFVLAMAGQRVIARTWVSPTEHLKQKSLNKGEMLEVRAGYLSALAVLEASGMHVVQSPALRNRSQDGSEGVVPAGEYFHEVRFIDEGSQQLAALVFVAEKTDYAKVICGTVQECRAQDESGGSRREER